MTKNELLKLVRGILTLTNEDTGEMYSESEIDRMVELFTKSIVSKKGSDLLFYPSLCGLSSDATVEEIVDRALQED